MSKKCSDCESNTKTLRDDPRKPPLSIEPCLCPYCFKNAVDDKIEELKNEMAMLETEKSKI